MQPQWLHATEARCRCDIHLCRGAGFTFLELLLVIVVLGIITGLVMPVLLREEAGRVLRRSVDQALAVMMLQEEEAVLSGAQQGLLIARQVDGDAGAVFFYRWFDWAAGEGRWVDADVPTRFNGVFDAVSEIELTIEGQEASIPDDAQGLNPQIIFYSSGEVTDFELRLAANVSDDMLVEWFLSGGYDGVRLDDNNEE